MRLARPRHQRVPVSLVAMIDVLMITLFFFMVTSTYLDLDMVPLAASDEDPPPRDGSAADPGGPLILRLGGDGRAHVRGEALAPGRLGAVIAERVAGNPALEILILPSGQASVQALATLIDAAQAAGAARLRILQIEALP